MNNKNHHPMRLAAGLLAALAFTHAQGAAFVRNPSFESNFHETWPHYGPVDEWPGASGVNDINVGNGGPFHNVGTPMPDRERVGFKQGAGDVTQEIFGLSPGRRYWVQIFYDARAGGGASEELVVYFDDVEIGRVPNMRPSTGPYYFLNSAFEAAAESGILRLHHIVSGDRTVLLDGINIVARDTNDVVLRNPSFEASGTLPAVGPIPNLAGWSQTGTVGVDDGTGGYADNGAIPDQALVAFIDGAGSLSQPLAGLIVGNQYELRVLANARNGTAPRLRLQLGDATLAEVNVAPGAYQLVSQKFTATVADAVLTLAQVNDGAHTLLLDDVRLLGTVRPPLPPLDFVPLVSEVGPGQAVTHTVTIPAAALEEGPVTVRLASSSPAIARLVGAGSDGVLTLTFNPGGPLTQPFEVEALRRGNAALNVLESGRIPASAVPAINVVGSFIKNASFESSVAPGFPGYGPVLGWQGTGGIGLNRTGGPDNPAGPFGDNGVVPDREQVAFIQGNGSLAQLVTGLAPGRRYWLQFHYNARNCCGDRTQKLTVNFAGQTLFEHAELVPVAAEGGTEYYQGHVAFTAAAAEGLLEFIHEATGDASLVIDAVSLVARAEGEIPVWNPSFEASGSPPGVGYLQPFRIAGWTGGPGGRGVNVNQQGPFTDNGYAPDQDRAGFLQGSGAFLSQVVGGLTAGQRYTLVLGINARNCCGGRPVARISAGGAPLYEEEIFPVGGANPYLSLYLPFTAEAADVEIKIEIAGAEPPGADVSLLFDDLHLVPGERTGPVILTSPESRNVTAGQSVSFEVNATGANLGYRWLRNGQLLTNGGRVSGANSNRLTLTGVTEADAGTYLVHVTDGLGWVGGDPAALTVEPGTVEPPALRAARLAGGNIRISWPVAAAGFVLQGADAVTGPYAPVTEPVGVEGAENVVTVPASGAARYFLLRQ